MGIDGHGIAGAGGGMRAAYVIVAAPGPFIDNDLACMMTFAVLMTALHPIMFEQTDVATTDFRVVVVRLALLLPAKGKRCGSCERV